MCKTYCKPKLKFKIFPLNTKQNKNMKNRLINKGKMKLVAPASWQEQDVFKMITCSLKWTAKVRQNKNYQRVKCDE